jgi:hypothetical protein
MDTPGTVLKKGINRILWNAVDAANMAGPTAAQREAKNLPPTGKALLGATLIGALSFIASPAKSKLDARLDAEEQERRAAWNCKCGCGAHSYNCLYS